MPNVTKWPLRIHNEKHLGFWLLGDYWDLEPKFSEEKEHHFPSERRSEKDKEHEDELASVFNEGQEF